LNSIHEETILETSQPPKCENVLQSPEEKQTAITEKAISALLPPSYRKLF